MEKTPRKKFNKEENEALIKKVRERLALEKLEKEQRRKEKLAEKKALKLEENIEKIKQGDYSPVEKPAVSSLETRKTVYGAAAEKEIAKSEQSIREAAEKIGENVEKEGERLFDFGKEISLSEEGIFKKDIPEDKEELDKIEKIEDEILEVSIEEAEKVKGGIELSGESIKLEDFVEEKDGEENRNDMEGVETVLYEKKPVNNSKEKISEKIGFFFKGVKKRINNFFSGLKNRFFSETEFYKDDEYVEGDYDGDISDEHFKEGVDGIKNDHEGLKSINLKTKDGDMFRVEGDHLRGFQRIFDSGEEYNYDSFPFFEYTPEEIEAIKGHFNVLEERKVKDETKENKERVYTFMSNGEEFKVNEEEMDKFKEFFKLNKDDKKRNEYLNLSVKFDENQREIINEYIKREEEKRFEGVKN